MNSHKFDDFDKINSIQKVSVTFSAKINCCGTSANRKLANRNFNDDITGKDVNTLCFSSLHGFP